jgi:hypothetical protein
MTLQPIPSEFPYVFNRLLWIRNTGKKNFKKSVERGIKKRIFKKMIGKSLTSVYLVTTEVTVS